MWLNSIASFGCMEIDMTHMGLNKKKVLWKKFKFIFKNSKKWIQHCKGLFLT